MSQSKPRHSSTHPELGKHRQADPWSFITRWACWIGELEVQWKNMSSNKVGGKVVEEDTWDLPLIYTHVHTVNGNEHLNTHIYTHTHTKWMTMLIYSHIHHIPIHKHAQSECPCTYMHIYSAYTLTHMCTENIPVHTHTYTMHTCIHTYITQSNFDWGLYFRTLGIQADIYR